MDSSIHINDAKSLFKEALNALKSLLIGENIFQYRNCSKECGINFFDDNINFYLKYLKDGFNSLFPIEPIEILVHELNQRNLIILLEYIEQLSKSIEDIYRDPLIKLNLSLIFGYFTDRLGKKSINTQEYFFLCLKELEKHYIIQNKNIKTCLDYKWMEKAQIIRTKFEKRKKENIEKIFSHSINIYGQKNKYEELENINKMYRSYKEDKNKLTMKDLESKYLTKELFKNSIKDFLEKKCEEYKYDTEIFKQKKEELYKSLFFENILNLDLTKIEEALILINIQKRCNDKPTDLDGMYSKYKNNYENITKESSNDLTDDLKQILDTNEFFENFFKILESKSVKNYLEAKRIFDKNNGDVKLVSSDEEEYDDDLSKEYLKLLGYIKEDKNCLRKLIIFKYLPKYKRSFVFPLMRIILNPLYIESSDLLRNDEDKRKMILKAYLNIILIHEIIHLLKYLKETFTTKNIPGTPKKKEGEEVFIKYLFGISKISNISYEQATKINDFKNWENIEQLHKIYEGIEENNQNEKKNRLNNNDSNYYIKFYNTDIEEEYSNDGKEGEKDEWCDL